MKYAAALMTALLLSACAADGAEGIRYYQLPDSAFRLPENNRAATGIRILLAEPLKTQNMLYQTDAHTLNFAQQNLWSAPLEESLAAALANKLNRQNRNVAYMPAKLSAAGTPVLTVYLDRFQGSHLGQTEISGYAQHPDGRRRPFHITTAQQGDGYAAMADSLNQGLEQAAAQIGR